MIAEPPFSIGIEEEYMLVDPDSRDLISQAPRGFMAQCQKRLGSQVSPEFLQCQVEVGTKVCANVKEARDNLAFLRATVAEIAAAHDARLVAVSTHPFAAGRDQARTRKKRYQMLAEDLQEVVRRLLISGMHVHVGIDDDDLRVDMMAQTTYFLPHLLALSTSSPFWRGNDTGLKSYRISVWDEMPRTGLPEYFDSFNEYRRHVDVLVKVGIIEDATKIWWDIRPSHRFPTLEMRISDVCTRMDDGVCVAALFTCWLRMLYRLRRDNQRWRTYARFLVEENRWRAQRYGVDGELIDFGAGEMVPYADLIEEILEFVAEDAEALDCEAEVQHAREIVAHGTSAHRQLAAFAEARTSGSDTGAAARAVVDMLIADTMRGI